MELLGGLGSDRGGAEAEPRDLFSGQPWEERLRQNESGPTCNEWATRRDPDIWGGASGAQKPTGPLVQVAQAS